MSIIIIILFVLFTLLGFIIVIMVYNNIKNSFMGFNWFIFSANMLLLILFLISLFSLFLELRILLMFFSCLWDVLGVVYLNVSFSFFYFTLILSHLFLGFLTYSVYRKYVSVFIFIFLTFRIRFGVTSIVLFYKSKGDRCVLSYLYPSDKIISRIDCFSLTDCFGSRYLNVNFFCEDGDTFMYNFTRFREIYKFEVFINDKISFALFKYSVHVYGEILKYRGGDFMSYWDFVRIFMLQVNGKFHRASVRVKSIAYFDYVLLDLKLEFWVSKLDLNGNFLDSFIKHLNKIPHDYKIINFNFLVEEYNIDVPFHKSSSSVSYSSLNSDYDIISDHVHLYFVSSNSFVKRNNGVLKKSYNLSHEDMVVLFNKCKNDSDYEVFLKYYRWS